MAAGGHAGHQAVRESCSMYSLGVLLYILLISIIVVSVRFLCCSVKPSLSQPMRFASFFPILLPTPVGEGAIERPCGSLLPAGAKP